MNKVDELQHELCKMKGLLETISEYRNRLENDRAINDALYWIIDKAIRALSSSTSSCKHEKLFAKQPDGELAVTFLNNKTGSETVGNYLVTVSANGNMIYQRSFRGHLKANGWRQLLWDFVETEIDKDEEKDEKVE